MSDIRLLGKLASRTRLRGQLRKPEAVASPRRRKLHFTPILQSPSFSNRSPTCGQHGDNNMGFKFTDWPVLICKLEAMNPELVQLNTLIWLVIPATKALVRLGTRGKPSHTTPSRQGSCQDHLHNRQSRQSLPILWCCQTLESESFVSAYTDLLELIHLNSGHSCQSMQ